MNREALFRIDRPLSIDGLAEHVHQTAQRLRADRDADRLAQVLGWHTAHEPFGRLHRHRAHPALAEMLLYLADDADGRLDVESFARDAHGVKDPGKDAFAELDVNRRTGDSNDFAYVCHMTPDS